MRKTTDHVSDFITLQSVLSEHGDLYIGEAQKQIPFVIRRFYVTMHVPPLAVRGNHAHKRQEQALFCLRGSCKVAFDDGSERWEMSLTAPTTGIRVRKAVWHSISAASPDAVLLTVADNVYDERDYIRTYDEFLSWIKRHDSLC